MHLSARSIRLMILSSFLLVCGIVCFPIVITALETMKASLIREKLKHLSSLASSRSHQIENFLDNQIAKLSLISSPTSLRYSLRTFSDNNAPEHQVKMNQILANAKVSSPHIQHISLIDLQGHVVASTDARKIGQDMRSQPEYQGGLLKGAVHSIQVRNSHPLISVTSPLKLENRNIGIAWSEMAAENLKDIALERTGLGRTGEVLIAGKTKKGLSLFLAPGRTDASIAFDRIFAQQHAALILRIINGEKSNALASRIRDYRNIPVLTAQVSISRMPWGVMAKMDLDEINEPINRIRMQTLLLLMLFFIPIVLLSAWLSKRLTRTLRSSEAKTKSIVEAAGDAILLLDKNACLIGVNEAAQKLFESTRENMIGRPAADLSPPHLRERNERLLKRIYDQKSFATLKHLELSGYTSAGHVVPLEISISRPTLEEHAHLIIICRDISNRKEAEDKLQETLQQQSILLDSQRQFVSIASHEFRTPISMISNAVQLLERSSSNIQQDYLLSKTGNIRVAISRMMLLMKSTLALSSMEQGTFCLTPEVCDIEELITEVCTYHQDLSKEHQISYRFSNMPKQIKADPTALEQILNNLIGNAIKYSPDSKPIEVEASGAGKDVVVIVRDYGLGIDEDELPKLFDRFYRAKTSVGISGAGIGLYLVKLFADMHDGTIAVESTKDIGTTFTLTLPVSGPGQKVARKVEAA